MSLTIRKSIIFLAVYLLFAVKSQEAKIEGREFNSYLPPEDGRRPEYHIYQYPITNTYKDDYVEYASNPMIPLLNKGLTLLLFKLGAVGIIKAILAMIFFGFLVKIPFILLKLAAMKSLFIPFLMIPLLMQMMTNQMSQEGDSATENKPGDAMAETPDIMGMNEINMNMERKLSENLSSVAWQSMRMFVESEQCVERISCMIGASSRDSSIGKVFLKMLKYLHYSSPTAMQKRISQIREAFVKGSTSTCQQEEYECQSPELLLQYGAQKLKIL